MANLKGLPMKEQPKGALDLVKTILILAYLCLFVLIGTIFFFFITERKEVMITYEKYQTECEQRGGNIIVIYHLPGEESDMKCFVLGEELKVDNPFK